MNDIAMSVVIINWENMFDDKFVQPRVFLNIYIYMLSYGNVQWKGYNPDIFYGFCGYISWGIIGMMLVP